MFSRWFFCRLRAAENALDDGRIDEAYRRLCQAELRADRRAGRLCAELAGALLARARLHVQAGRYAEALDDLDKLAALGRCDPDADTLRQRAAAGLRRQRGNQEQQNEVYARAAENLRAGRLESGRLAIERVADTRRRDRLRDELDIRVARSAQLLAQARAALEQGDALGACRFWAEARQRHGRSRQSDALAGQVAAALRGALEELFDQGRLDRFLALLRAAAPLGGCDPGLEEYERLGALCAQAGAQLALLNERGLHETLLRLRAARRGAGWVEQALAASGAIEQARERLVSSPLGLLGVGVEEAAGVVKAPAAPGLHDLVEAGAAAPAAGEGLLLGQGPLLMLIDGTGSVLLVRREVVRIGRAGGGAGLEAPIPADIRSHHADIIRDGEDYFLAAYGPARVNNDEQQARRPLLRDGDRITLGRKARLVFRKPTAKSASAVLKLADRCRLPQDVGRILLFQDTALVGPQPSCHIQTREGQTRLVLFARGGRLYGRLTAADGGPAAGAVAVRLGQTQHWGDQRITVKPYEPSAGAGAG